MRLASFRRGGAFFRRADATEADEVIVNQLPGECGVSFGYFWHKPPHSGVQSPRCSPAPLAEGLISISTTSSSEASSSNGVFGAQTADTVAWLAGRRSAACW